MGFEPKYDDNKKNNTIYFGKSIKKPDGTSYRHVEVLIDEEESYLSEKNKEPNSTPVDFIVKDKIELYRSPGGQQKVSCWLIENSSEKYINALHISRRKSKGVYGSQEITIRGEGILALQRFLFNLVVVDNPNRFKLPIELHCSQNNNTQIITEEEFVELIKANVKSTDDFYKLLSIQKMNLAIERLEQIISGDYKNEVDIQHFLKDNIWMFGNDYVYVVEDEKINTQNILDMIPQDFESYIDIIEVKLPNEKLFNFDRSHNNHYTTSHLTKAIAQTQNYIFELEKKTSNKEYSLKNNCKVVRPKGIILFGSIEPLEDEERQYLRILNSSYHNLNIITYQQLLEKAKNTLKIYNNK